uniref:Uncharacterized protein n=1 Tax=viral metagenome TaxID=1070528 RepID=A0A6M3Y1V2_9ZZZZ
MKKYNVIWSERHALIVKAENKDEAIEKAMQGEVISDDSIEIDSPPEAFELSK